jgi:hypothetical protein
VKCIDERAHFLGSLQAGGHTKIPDFDKCCFGLIPLIFTVCTRADNYGGSVLNTPTNPGQGAFANALEYGGYGGYPQVLTQFLYCACAIGRHV